MMKKIIFMYMSFKQKKKILVALDYDPSAQKVAETGYALSQAMNAETILLHVISDPAYYSSLNYSPIMGFGGVSSIGTVQTDSSKGLQKVAQTYLDKTKQHLGNDSMQTIVKSGNYGETILTT